MVSTCHSIFQRSPLSCLPQLLSLFSQVDIFRGFTLPEGPMFRQVFGGQLIGQALFLPPSLPDIPFCLISLVLFFFLKHAGELRIIVLIGIKFLDTRRIHGLDQYFYTCVPENKGRLPHQANSNATRNPAPLLLPWPKGSTAQRLPAAPLESVVGCCQTRSCSGTSKWKSCFYHMIFLHDSLT